MAMKISFLIFSKIKIYDNLTSEINIKPFSSLLSFPLLCIPLHGHCTKMQFSIKDFFSTCDQIRSFLRIRKTSLMENIIFCALHFVRMLQFPETQSIYCSHLLNSLKLFNSFQSNITFLYSLSGRIEMRDRTTMD